MKFRSNNCVAIYVTSLKKARRFYGTILGFPLKEKSKDRLMFDTGHFLLYVKKAKKTGPPIPSFDLADVAKARRILRRSGCRIVKEWKRSLYFSDPFGITFDIIETEAP